jgi:hypothetical protein
MCIGADKYRNAGQQWRIGLDLTRKLDGLSCARYWFVQGGQLSRSMSNSLSSEPNRVVEHGIQGPSELRFCSFSRVIAVAIYHLPEWL